MAGAVLSDLSKLLPQYGSVLSEERRGDRGGRGSLRSTPPSRVVFPYVPSGRGQSKPQ